MDHGSDYCDHFPCHLPQGDCKTCDGGPKGMNAYTISSGIFPKYLNGENIISVPLAENETMHNNMAMDMDTGDIHMISSWPNDDDEDN